MGAEPCGQGGEDPGPVGVTLGIGVEKGEKYSRRSKRGVSVVCGCRTHRVREGPRAAIWREGGRPTQGSERIFRKPSFSRVLLDILEHDKSYASHSSLDFRGCTDDLLKVQNSFNWIF